MPVLGDAALPVPGFRNRLLWAVELFDRLDHTPAGAQGAVRSA
jgi:hypothetical protein